MAKAKVSKNKARFSKKKLRRLNQRAGKGVMPSVHPMTNIVLKSRGAPEGSGEASDRYQKGNHSWVNADIRRPRRPWEDEDAAEGHSD
jgi:hypothetical protein